MPEDNTDRATPDTEKTLPSFGLTVSSVAFIYLVWRILSVADYDANTALGIIQSGGAANAAMGIALSSAGLVLLVLNALWVFSVIFDADFRNIDNDLKIVIAIPVLIGVLSLLPLFLSVANFIFMTIMTIVWRTGRGQQVPHIPGVAFVVFIVWLASPFWLTISTPWMPSERITPQGAKSFTGYVVGVDGESVVVLDRNDDVHLRRIPANGLEREICSTTKPWILRSVEDIYRGDGPYPPCP
ncbi:hypothetical protein [Nocardioides sp. NPDC004968]|uniref:hypothetical protein n=1 Tax=Nocardioides sp. NPDC004968 TaxID=3155894 RepID=UPI0033B9D0FF